MSGCRVGERFGDVRQTVCEDQAFSASGDIRIPDGPAESAWLSEIRSPAEIRKRRSPFRAWR